MKKSILALLSVFLITGLLQTGCEFEDEATPEDPKPAVTKPKATSTATKPAVTKPKTTSTAAETVTVPVTATQTPSSSEASTAREETEPTSGRRSNDAPASKDSKTRDDSELDIFRNRR